MCSGFPCPPHWPLSQGKELWAAERWEAEPLKMSRLDKWRANCGSRRSEIIPKTVQSMVSAVTFAFPNTWHGCVWHILTSTLTWAVPTYWKKGEMNLHQETKALQIYSEEKVSFLCQGELNLSRYWFSRTIWWSAINRLDSMSSMLIPAWPYNLLLCDKIYFILKIKVVNQNKIIEHVPTPFSLLVSCISFLVHILFLKQQIFKFTYLMLSQIKAKHCSHFPRLLNLL